MSSRRKKLNILLIIIAIILGGWAAWLYRRPPLVLSAETTAEVSPDTLTPEESAPGTVEEQSPADQPTEEADTVVQEKAAAEETDLQHPTHATRFKDIELQYINVSHPFRTEAIKVLNGHLEETDSISRHKILSYCEHLRTSYTTRDIDFIRQVFSDNALIIVGQVVNTSRKSTDMIGDPVKVNYIVRTKQSYLEKLEKIFNSGKDINVDFSDFKIMRHPTADGIYGVTLRQQYSSGQYSDDGYLFLLWDFRNPSMPLIHVRTWQPTATIDLDNEELIDISGFNLE